MTGPDERPSRLGNGRSSGRILVCVSVVLAVAAAAVLVLGFDDARLLRLGIVAALWSALAGSFAAARMRREAVSAADRAEDRRAIYQLELEREVAARREHELTVERDLRRDIEQGSRDELDALRAELHTLRCNLESVLGGDVLVERVALRAESTRVTSLPDPATQTANVQPALPVSPERADPSRRPRPETPPRPEPTGYDQDPLFGDAPWKPDLNNGTTSEPNGNGTYPANGQWRGPAAPEERGAAEEPDSANTGKRSVDELLAAYGGSTAPRRRRRRDDG